MKKIVILSGWTWDEREVALRSATYFSDNIEQDYDYYVLPEQLNEFIANKDLYHLAIPVFHWEYGEDGRIFAFLDILGIPQVWPSYAVHSLCLDKIKTNMIVEKLWYNVPKEITIKKGIQDLPIMDLDFPLIIKPNKWWSSFHTYKLNDQQELHQKFSLMQKDIDDDIIVQEYIVWKEYSVPIIAWEILPIMLLEKQNDDDFFDYESKYESEDRIKETFPDNINVQLNQELWDTSLELYNFLNIKWYCRFDYLVRDNKVYFLEVNTIPGMSPASIVPKSWEKTWWTKPQLVQKIISDI